jgi:hypothetical protein
MARGGAHLVQLRAQRVRKHEQWEHAQTLGREGEDLLPL